MRKTIVLIFLSSILIQSCGFSKDDSDLFPKSFSVKGTIPNIKESYLQGVVHIYDSLLIITNTPKSKTQFHLYNKNSFKYICSSGRTGRGPGEITNPFSAEMDKDNGVLWFMDLGNMRFWKFDLEEIIKNPKSIPTEYIPIETRQIIMKFSYLRDDILYYVNENPSVIASFFDLDGNEVKELQLNNKINLYSDMDLSFNKRRTFLYYLINHHPEEQLFAVTYRFSNLIVIVDNKGSVKYSSHDLNDKSITPDLNKEIIRPFITYVQSNQKYIYLLYNIKKDENLETNEISAKEIHVINWKAEPIAKINLDNEIYTFDIDSENNRIVAFSEEVGIVYYDIPKMLQLN